MKKQYLALGCALIAGALTLAAPLAASAHDELIDSTPTSGQTLTALPDTFSVTMNEPLLALDGSNAFALQITDAAGAYYGDGCLTEDGATLSTPAALGAAGSYTLAWQVVSNDGHPVSGEIPFTWQPPADAVPSPALVAPPVCGEDPQPVVTEEPSSAPTPEPSPSAEAPAASAIDPALVGWIGGGVLVAGLAVAAAILIASRRRRG
jgi:methionine-rich copper-binding protein CopC